MKVFILVIVVAIVHQAFAEELKLPKVNHIQLETKQLKLKDFHTYHVNEFAKADGFGERRVIIIPKIVNLVVDGQKFKMNNMSLLSVTDRKKPVIWELPVGSGSWLGEGLNRKMIKSGHMKKRVLEGKELKSLTALRKGGEWGLIKKEGNVSLTAPLFAGVSCIRCHEDYKEGEFMGAFKYDLKIIEANSDDEGQLKELGLMKK